MWIIPTEGEQIYSQVWKDVQNLNSKFENKAIMHDSNKVNKGSLTGLTVELSIPGSCLEFGLFSADCSPKAPQHTRMEGDTSLC